jgi:hypothetical protein
MWEPRRLTNLWPSTACYRKALPFSSFDFDIFGRLGPLSNPVSSHPSETTLHHSITHTLDITTSPHTLTLERLRLISFHLRKKSCLFFVQNIITISVISYPYALNITSFPYIYFHISKILLVFFFHVRTKFRVYPLFKICVTHFHDDLPKHCFTLAMHR